MDSTSCQVDNHLWKAHQIAWVSANGPIPDGLNVLHRCDNPPCCRPEHLFLGTQKDNVRDCMAKGRFVLPPLHVGENQHLSKLTAKTVRRIRGIHLSGRGRGERGTKAVARAFGVSIGTIKRIINRQTWKHVA